ncbi:MAG: hypothetical protein HXX13_09995 [Bacteroidetes bacterium]|nr:hypothetical protein [Bacteroidota bacterium]
MRTTFSIILIALSLSAFSQEKESPIHDVDDNAANTAIKDYISSMNLTIDFQQQRSDSEAVFHVIKPEFIATPDLFLTYVQSRFNLQTAARNYKVIKEWNIETDGEGNLYSKCVRVKHWLVWAIIAMPTGDVLFSASKK